jgi:hypothetical protein
MKKWLKKITGIERLEKEREEAITRATEAKAQEVAAKEAEEMEKEQITEAFEDGNEQGFICKTGEEYYNETYKKIDK